MVPPSELLPCRGGGFDPGPSLIRRLTPWEYANSVRFALGVDVDDIVHVHWPPLSRTNGFGNDARSQAVTATHVEAFEAIARDVAVRVDFDALRESCPRSSPEACVQFLSEVLIRRLLRNPHESQDFERYMTLVETAPTSSEGLVWLIRALLQAPSFLYRIEEGAVGNMGGSISPPELAVRLAYFIWGAPPDAILIDAAAQGRLSTEAQIRKEVRRLLADDRSIAQSIRLVQSWFGVNPRSPSIVGVNGVDARLAADIYAETPAFVEHVLWTRRQPFRALFTSRESVLSARLAQWYGLQTTGPETGVYALPRPRRGLLTQAAIVAQAGGPDASMIARGLYILENVLCQSIPPPPSELDRTGSDYDLSGTRRTVAEARLLRAECAGCHSVFEPLAFAYERFDGAGRYSLQDANGRALRGAGRITLQTGEYFEWSDADDFAGRLLETEASAICLVAKPLAFALGRVVETHGSDACAVREILASSNEAGGTYPALVEAIATHRIFREIRAVSQGD